MYDTFDATVTIFNKRWDKELDRDVWTRTVVRGASWHGKRAASVSDNGLQAASLYTVRIPARAMPKGYLHPDVFNAAQEAPDGWTVQSGDIVVKGEVTQDIQAAKDITKKIECFTVLAIRDNRRGPSALRHLRIEGA